MKTKTTLLLLLLMLMATTIVGCESEASVASYNVSEAADNFEVPRVITFINDYTGLPALIIEGFCSIEDQSNQLEVTCKTEDDEYLKHFLGLGGMSYVVEQRQSVDVSTLRYKMTFAPSTLIPDIDIRTSEDGKQ